MGNSVTKLDEKQRLKIYKRVSLLEARDQYAKIAAELLKQKYGQHSYQHLLYFVPFAKPPISMNFRVVPDTGDGKFATLTLSKDELSGKGAHVDIYICSIFHFLSFTLAKDTILPEYYLGLDQEQHDLLWLDTPVTAAAKIATAVKMK